MQVWHGLLWGAVGGAVVEAYDTLAVIRSTSTWPWLDSAEQTSTSQRWSAFGLWLFAAIIRIAAGAGTAAAASGQVSGELGAFGLGVAGPLALERILATTGLPRPPTPPSPPAPQISETTDAH